MTSTSTSTLKCYGNGFYVPYEIRPCPPKGNGVCALADIKQGQLIWHCDTDAIVRHNEESFRKRLAACADDEERKYLLNHCYSVAQHGDDVLESLGSTGVYNHSKTPTTGGGDVLQKITGKTGSLKPEGWPDDKPFDEINCNFALRDIKAGEEFTDDYSIYNNPQWYVDLCKEYGVEWAGKVAELYD